MNSVDANYFDGRTSRGHAVLLSVDDDTLAIEGDGVARRVCLAEVRVSEPLMHAPRVLTFPDAAFCEIADNAAFAQMLARSGHRDSLVVAWQSRW
ncbi:MAG: peptidase M48, partial [Burkholderiaceae bacterium]|nr:peptidase M48 [Burkholderiaceae bacterium]